MQNVILHIGKTMQKSAVNSAITMYQMTMHYAPFLRNLVANKAIIIDRDQVQVAQGDLCN